MRFMREELEYFTFISNSHTLLRLSENTLLNLLLICYVKSHGTRKMHTHVVSKRDVLIQIL
jgi:hypothetical protein